jgi:hypothetical protein
LIQGTGLTALRLFKVVGSARRYEVPKNAHLIWSDHPFLTVFNRFHLTGSDKVSDGVGMGTA